MAKLSSGILGGISGTVGNVVGGRWRGIDYIRSKPANVKNPNTEAQQAQRKRFKLVIAFLKRIRPLIRAGFRNGARNQTFFNRAMSVNLREAVSGAFPNLELDPQLLVFAQGELPGARSPQMDASAAGVITLTWNNNGGSGGASDQDGAMALLYNEDTQEVIYSLNGAGRQDELLDIAIPAEWSGDTVAAHIAFRSEDAPEVSNSRYIGSETAT